MNGNHPLAVAIPPKLPLFACNPEALAEKEDALQVAALIGKVTDRDSKIIAVRAQQELKRVISVLEKARQEAKEPLLNAGRQLDTLIATEKLPLEKEFGRVSSVVKEFDDAERRRVLEEERLQREELAKIEAAKQAELKRIADEQAAREVEARRVLEEADRKVREAQATAARLAAEATTKKQRQDALRAAEEAERQKAIADAEKARQEATLREQAATTAAQAAAVEEKAGDAAYAAARPIEATKVAGQRQSTNWIITVTNPYELAKFHPDMVNITPRLSEIKAALNEGREIRGIRAERETKSDVRLPSSHQLIEV